MKRLHMRSFAFAFSLIVFACLLAAGGNRLIGHEGGCVPAHPCEAAMLCGALCAAPAPSAEISFAAQQEKEPHRSSHPAPARRSSPCAAVCSDANGNVLGGQSYLHAVYQAFSLGDGFV